MVRRRFDEVARLVPSLVDRLAESLGAVGGGRPRRKGEAAADHPLALEEEDEVVEPVDQQGACVAGGAGELVAHPLLDLVEGADELEERDARGGEELRPLGGADDEADVRLVLERLPAQE